MDTPQQQRDSQILQALTCFSFPSPVDLFPFREMVWFLAEHHKKRVNVAAIVVCECHV
jgi:hypothetical protein